MTNELLKDREIVDLRAQVQEYQKLVDTLNGLRQIDREYIANLEKRLMRYEGAECFGDH